MRSCRVQNRQFRLPVLALKAAKFLLGRPVSRHLGYPSLTRKAIQRRLNRAKYRSLARAVRPLLNVMEPLVLER
jgi:hypothetical protein